MFESLAIAAIAAILIVELDPFAGHAGYSDTKDTKMNIAMLAWMLGPWEIALILMATLLLFGGKKLAEGMIVKRIALTMDQVVDLDLPPCPAKPTDSRSAKYIEEYGDEAWELDALEPPMIIELIQETIAQYIDTDLWSAAAHIQNEGRMDLQLLTKHFDDATQAAEYAEENAQQENDDE